MMHYFAVIFIFGLQGASNEPYLQNITKWDDMVTCEREKDLIVESTKELRPGWIVKGVCEPLND